MITTRTKRVLLAILFLGVVVFAVAQYTNSRISGGTELKEHAVNILEKCITGSSSGERRICYEAEVPKLLDTISLKDAFRIT